MSADARMNLTITKRDFLRALARTHGVADRKSSMPILTNVLLTADDGAVRIAATDLYLGVAATVPAEVRTGGAVAVAARTLFDIVKNMPEGDMTWSVGANYAAELRSGKVRFRIPGMPGDDFPPLPAPRELAFASIEVSVLADLIAKTSYSMSTDDTRPHLAGALFESDGRVLRMVSTDGHRLSKAEREIPGEIPGLKMLVTNKGIGELKRLLDDAKTGGVEIASDNVHAFFRREGLVLSVKLADEQFPPYEKVIPSRHTKRVVCSRDALVEALRRMSLMSNRTSGGVVVTLSPGVLRVSSEDPDHGDAAEDIDVDYDGGALKIGFSARYVLDAIGCLEDDEVTLEFTDELDPGVVKPTTGDQFVGVVMPMRV